MTYRQAVSSLKIPLTFIMMWDVLSRDKVRFLDFEIHHTFERTVGATMLRVLNRLLHAVPQKIFIIKMIAF